MKLLLIGPLPPPVGGTTVLFRQLVEELGGIANIQVINTSRAGTGFLANMAHGLRVLFQLLTAIGKSDVVSFHTSINGALFFGPWVCVICRIFGKRWIFRAFGGNFDEWYAGQPALIKAVFRNTVLRADVPLFETKKSVLYFQGISKCPVRWYANSRPYTESSMPVMETHHGARRFVYLGHVKITKGIYEIIAAGEMLGEEVAIDVYGPLSDGICADTFSGKKVRYMGVVEPDKVSEILRKYDVLLLPSFHEGEGYPGVILEAYGVSLPVITTRWRTIPEIVNDKSGMLIEPKSAAQLKDAMQILIDSPDRLHELKVGAASMAREYSSAVWAKQFMDIVAGLMKKK